jgi:general secretion pathway protein A
MYLSHFQLEKEPFNISPDPAFLWLSEKHARAFETLKEGILERDGCVLLTGDIGTGKTTLIKRLVKLDDVAAIFVTVNDPDLSGLDFFNILAAEFEMGRRFDDREAFLAGFRHFLLGAFSAYKKVLIIIDEAQRLNTEILRETVVLSNLKMAGRKLLKVFFVGQLEFNEMLGREENREVLANISAHFYLEPLTQEETGRYVEHRLKVAGRGAPLFDAGAVGEIHRLSKGYPRLINIICDHALLYGYGSNLSTLDGEVVKTCSRDLTVALDLEDDRLEKERLVATVEEAIDARGQAAPARDRSGRRPYFYIAAAMAAMALILYLLTR